MTGSWWRRSVEREAVACGLRQGATCSGWRGVSRDSNPEREGARMFPPRTTGWIYSQAVPGFFFTGGYCCQGSTTAYHTFCGNKLGGVPMQTTQRWDGGAWSTRSDCPLPARQDHSSANVDGTALICGGTSGIPLVDCDRYQSMDDSWISATNLPLPARFDHSSASAAGVAFALMGRDISFGNLRDNDRYSNNTWVSRTDCPVPARSHTASTAAQGRVLLFCGDAGSNVFSRDCDEYIDLTDHWVAKTDCPAPAREGHGCFALGSSCFIVGGGLPLLVDTDQYNVDVESWASMQDLPLPARQWGGSSSTTQQAVGWFTAGEGSSGVRLRDHDEFSGTVWISRTDLPLDARKLNASAYA